jgi:hypothetical protein
VTTSRSVVGALAMADSGELIRGLGGRVKRGDRDAAERTDGVLGTRAGRDVGGDLVLLGGQIGEGLGRMVRAGGVLADQVGVRSGLRHLAVVRGRLSGRADCALIGWAKSRESR